MATDLEKLVVQLSADMKVYEREMRKASGISAKEARVIEGNFRAMQKRLDVVGRSAARAITVPLAGIAAALGARQLIEMTSQWTDLNSQVRLAAGGLDAGRAAMDRLSEVARRTYSDLATTVEGFTKFAPVLRELGVSSEQQLDFIETLNNGLVVSGAKGDQAARVLDALSKAMALGTLQGDNLNTVVAQGGRVAEALAASLGVGVTELRRLGQEGKIGRREMLAITSQMGKLRDEAAAMPGTIKDGFLLLNNALLEYVGRGDEARGISAQIAEALTLIADNFDVVADRALQVAAVIAGALVGRSLGGLVRTLGSATTVLVKFGAALRAAATMSSLSASMGGLGAIAGPLGAIFGTLLAGGLLLYSSRSAEAAERTDAVRAELERLGLSAPQAASGVQQVATAVGQLVDAAKALQQMKDEFERAALGSWSEWMGLPQAEDSLLTIANMLDVNTRWWAKFSDAEKQAMTDARNLIREFQSGERSLSSFLSEADRLAQLNLGGAAGDLLTRMRDLALYLNSIDQALTLKEAPAQLDELNAQIDLIVRNLQTAAAEFGIAGDDIVAEVKRISDELRDGKISADEANAALAAIAGSTPKVGPFVEALQPLMAALDLLRAKALAANAALPGGGGGVQDPEATDNAHARAVEAAAVRDYLKEQDRLRSRTKEQIALERAVESARRRALEAGINGLTEAQLLREAQMDLAAEAARAASGKGGGGRRGRDDGLFEDAEREIAALSREVEMLGQSSAAAARARAEQDLLNEAKQRGIPITDALRQQIGQHADEVGRLTGELERGQTTQERFEQGVEDISRAFADAIVAGEDLRASIANILRRIASDILTSGISKLIGSLFGGLIGGGSAAPVVPSARGNVFSGAGIAAFSGQVVSKPTVFPFAKGVGLMGEAGPEAILPLTRIGGKLGVRAQGAGAPVTININLAGANGNSEVARIAVAAVQEGLRAYDRTVPDRARFAINQPRYP